MAARCAAMRGASASTVISALTSFKPAARIIAATGAGTPGCRRRDTRIAVREMPPDVALAERAEHGIAERVNHHVAVGVRHDAPMRERCARRRA